MNKVKSYLDLIFFSVLLYTDNAQYYTLILTLRTGVKRRILRSEATTAIPSRSRQPDCSWHILIEIIPRTAMHIVVMALGRTFRPFTYLIYRLTVFRPTIRPSIQPTQAAAMLTPYLSTREVLTVGAGLLLAWYVASSLAAIYRLRHIPGPFFARFSYLPHLYILCTGQVKTAYQGMHDRLAGGGPFVTIAPGVVVTNDPDVLRRIGSARSPYRRHDWYRAARFHHEYENTGCIVDNEAHVKAKAKTASGYSGREVGAEFEPAIDAVIEDLVDLIRRKYLSGGAAGGEEEGEEKAADVSILIRLFTVDVITRLGYGRSFGHLDEGTDRYGFLEDASRSLVANSLIMEIPLLRWLVFGKVGLLGLLGPRETDKSGAGKIMGYVRTNT